MAPITRLTTRTALISAGLFVVLEWLGARRSQEQGWRYTLAQMTAAWWILRNANQMQRTGYYGPGFWEGAFVRGRDYAVYETD